MGIGESKCTFKCLRCGDPVAPPQLANLRLRMMRSQSTNNAAQ